MTDQGTRAVNERTDTVATITIHYESPKGDPFKVPRPHRIDIDERGAASAPYGGEIGPVHYLIGFCATVVPIADAFEVIHASKLYDGEVQPDDLVGWYPQFVNTDGVMFGYGMRIKRIEVTQ